MTYLFFPQLYIKIVSHDVEKLEKATVILNNLTNRQDTCVIKMTEKEQLNKLYGTIKNTNKIFLSFSLCRHLNMKIDCY